MKSGTETTPAFVLRSVEYGESDRILTFLTAKLGKISAYARGARKSQKRFGGALEPFALIEITVAPGRGGKMMSLSEATQMEANQGIAQNLRRLEVGSYLLELVRESLPSHAPDPKLFEFVTNAIREIGRAAPDHLPKLTIAVVLGLFACLGMEMGVSSCTGCGRVIPEGKPVLFHPGRGGVVCTPCGGGPIRLEAASIALLQRLAKAPIDSVCDIRSTSAEEKELRLALRAFVEHHLEKPLKTAL